MMFANTVDFRLSLDFFDSSLYTRTAVARLTLALAKLSCFYTELTVEFILIIASPKKTKDEDNLAEF